MVAGSPASLLVATLIARRLSGCVAAAEIIVLIEF